MDQQSDINKAMIRRFVEEVKNKRQLDLLEDIFRSDYQEHNATVSSFGQGVGGYKNFLNHLFTAFPEDTVTIDEIVAEGDMVVYRGTETGTHKAEFLLPASTRHGLRFSSLEYRMARLSNIGLMSIFSLGSSSLA